VGSPDPLGGKPYRCHCGAELLWRLETGPRGLHPVLIDADTKMPHGHVVRQRTYKPAAPPPTAADMWRAVGELQRVVLDEQTRVVAATRDLSTMVSGIDTALDELMRHRAQLERSWQERRNHQGREEWPASAGARGASVATADHGFPTAPPPADSRTSQPVRSEVAKPTRSLAEELFGDDETTPPGSNYHRGGSLV
jgi:hypothetical protein